MKKIIFALLWCYAIQAQMFDFNCEQITFETLFPEITDTYDVDQFALAFVNRAREQGYIIPEAELNIIVQGGDDWGANVGRATRICGDSKYTIMIKEEFWTNPYETAEDPFWHKEQRLALIFHELGHEILGLRHAYFTDIPWNFMRQGVANQTLVSNPANLVIALERLFDTTRTNYGCPIDNP